MEILSSSSSDPLPTPPPPPPPSSSFCSSSSSIYNVNLHYLMVTDPLGPSTLSLENNPTLDEPTLLQCATRSCQALITQLFKLPFVSSSFDISSSSSSASSSSIHDPPSNVLKTTTPWTVTLPTFQSSKFKLPRSLPLPDKKPETKWERFAKEKGIAMKKKKSKKVFDPDTKTWKPRYGYRSKQNVEPWLIPVKDGDDPYKDLFEERRQEKKARVAKNEKQHVRNLQRHQLQVELNTASVGRFNEKSTPIRYQPSPSISMSSSKKQTHSTTSSPLLHEIAHRVVQKLPNQEGELNVSKSLGQFQQFEQRSKRQSKSTFSSTNKHQASKKDKKTKGKRGQQKSTSSSSFSSSSMKNRKKGMKPSSFGKIRK